MSVVVPATLALLLRSPLDRCSASRLARPLWDRHLPVEAELMRSRESDQFMEASFLVLCSKRLRARLEQLARPDSRCRHPLRLLRHTFRTHRSLTGRTVSLRSTLSPVVLSGVGRGSITR